MPTPSIDARMTPAMLQILLALAESDLHGYGIMQAIDERTDGSMDVGPGTLYRTIGHLLERGWIREVETGDKRRRAYAITPDGREAAGREAHRLSLLVSWATRTHLIQGPE